jgi:hypothetical protein
MMTAEPLLGDNSLDMEIIQWGYAFLYSHGYTLKNNAPEIVQQTPWSCVLRFLTTEGLVYLKHTPRLLALEAKITQILHNQFHAPVPEVIACSEELNCFLMKDAGSPLRNTLKKYFDATLLCKAVDQFTSMQLMVADHINVFLDIGVPDWRLDKLPDLYEKFLIQKDMLRADGLSEKEIIKLERLVPTVSRLCKKLSEYAIKQTIVQPDFHDNNLLIDSSQNITILDLGEVVVSHPFFSLITCLQQAKRHHGLRDEDGAYLQIKDACLKNYMKIESRQNVLDAFATAQIVLHVYGALAGARLMIACGKEKLISFQPGKFGHSLRELIVTCAVING